MSHRLIVVFGPEGDRRVTGQMRRLAADRDGARRRDAGYVEVRRQSDPESFLELAGVAPGAFAVVVVDKDGAELFRSDRPLSAAAIWRAIDERSGPER